MNIKAKSISCGDSHTMIIDLNNNVWAFGNNGAGQLGLGDTQPRNRPTQVQGIKAKSVACGAYHTIIIDLDNNVWGFGNNSAGQLGLGDKRNKNRPTPILFPGDEIKAKSVSCGFKFTIIIDTNNNVWSFGDNGSGQLGLGDKQDKNSPTQVQGIKAKSVSCGGAHTMLINLNNNIVAFGNNTLGQLSLGSANVLAISVPTQIHSTNTETALNARTIFCGSNYTMMIDLDNNIWSCGDNGSGQLGLGDTQNRNILTQIRNIKAKSVSCGDGHTMIIDFDNNVWAFGFNRLGQLGLGLENNQNRDIPTKINNTKARFVSCGSYYTMIILHPTSTFESNVYLLPFNEVVKSLNAGDFLRFDFLPQYQTIPHNPRNYIATFYANNDNVYLAELQYNQATNQILPPV